MDHLIDAWNAFSALPRQHPSEATEFTDAIHVCQGLLARRVVQRVYPLGWPTYRPEGG